MWVKFFIVFWVFRVGLWLEMIVISPCGGYNPPPTTPWSFKHCWCIEIIIFLPTYFLRYYVHNISESMYIISEKVCEYKFITVFEVFKDGLWLEMIVISWIVIGDDCDKSTNLPTNKWYWSFHNCNFIIPLFSLKYW